MDNSRILAVFLVASVFVRTGSALACYVCDPDTDPHSTTCDYAAQTHIAEKQRGVGYQFAECYKMYDVERSAQEGTDVFHLNGLTSQRSSSEAEVRSTGFVQYFCQTTLCNSSTVGSGSAVLSAVTCALAMVFPRY